MRAKNVITNGTLPSTVEVRRERIMGQEQEQISAVKAIDR